MAAGLRIEGRDAALGALAAVIARIEHQGAMFEEIGAMLVASTQRRFETETSPAGNPWPRSIRALVDGGKTLTDNAGLRNSITFDADDGGVAVGTNVIYAGIHQEGGVIKAKTSRGLRFRAAGNGSWVTKQSVTIPARPFLGLDDSDEAELIRIAGDYIGGDDAGR